MPTKTIEVPYRRCALSVDEDLYGEQLLLPISVVRTIDKLLPKQVRNGFHENVLYIAGSVDQNIRVGSVVLAPQAETGPGHFRTDRASHQQVLRALSDLDLEVVAQVHCHPGFIVAHSDGDDELAFIKGEGFWSLIVPDYGRRGVLPFANCGMHCYSQGQFRILDPAASAARVRLLPDYLDLREGRR